MSFEYWIDISDSFSVDMYAAAERVLGGKEGTGWAEVHAEDQPPVMQRVVVSILVGVDIIKAVHRYEEILAYNADRIIGGGGYIRLRAITEDNKTGTVVAQRAPNGVSW